MTCTKQTAPNLLLSLNTSENLEAGHGFAALFLFSLIYYVYERNAVKIIGLFQQNCRLTRESPCGNYCVPAALSITHCILRTQCTRIHVFREILTIPKLR
jgi:F0F1-type ATP synthase membrane subunit a